MFDLVLFWEATKKWLSETLHVSHWMLHVVAGLALFLAFCWMMKRPFSSPLPLLPVAVFELVNEAFDVTRYYVSGWPWTPGSTLIDIAVTLVPPACVILIARMWARSKVAGSAAGQLPGNVS